MSRTLQVVYQPEMMSHHADVVLSLRSLYIHSRIPEITISRVAECSIYKNIVIASF